MNNSQFLFPPSCSCENQSFESLCSTSAYFDIPCCATLNSILNDRIIVILRHARILNHRELLNDFYNILKRHLENKLESNVMEASFKYWLKQAVVKCNRKRQQILSESISAGQAQMILALSDIVFDALCDFVVESSGFCKVSKTLSSEEPKTIQSEMLLPVSSCLTAFNSSSNCKKLCVSESLPDLWLKKFWLEFCYEPDPTHSINLMQPTATRNTINNFFPIQRNAQKSKEESSNLSVSSEENSDSSGSWSCEDFNDDSFDQALSTSRYSFLEKYSTTMNWLQSTSCLFSSDSEDDGIAFGDAITEENCIDKAVSKGSLCFVDIDSSDDDDTDEYEVFFTSDARSTSKDVFEGLGEVYDNPCFEEDVLYSFSMQSFIETVNSCWDEDMLQLDDKPRQPSKVSFAPDSNLVSICYYEETEEKSFDASLILDRLRFRYRIKELSCILSPFFTKEHRREVCIRNGFYEL